MCAGEGTSPPHVLAAGHKERFAVFEERNHLFTNAFHLFQHGMELEQKGSDTDVLKCVELIGDLLGGGPTVPAAVPPFVPIWPTAYPYIRIIITFRSTPAIGSSKRRLGSRACSS